MAAHDSKQQCSDWQNLIALPEHLLERIIVGYTTKEEKKALRQTCKLLQNSLDDRLSCIQVTVASSSSDRHTMKQLLKRMQQVPGLETVVLQSEPSATLNSFLHHLPGHISRLRMIGNVIASPAIPQLPRLISLSLDIIEGSITGLQCITGLTYLRYRQKVGSVAHLAPTLKQLDMGDFINARDASKLTNLEAL